MFEDDIDAAHALHGPSNPDVGPDWAMLADHEVEYLGSSLSIQDLEINLLFLATAVGSGIGGNVRLQEDHCSPSGNAELQSAPQSEDVPAGGDDAERSALQASPSPPQSPATFINSLRLPLVTPLLRSPPRTRVARDDDTWVPCRSNRLAAKAPFRDLQP